MRLPNFLKRSPSARAARSPAVQAKAGDESVERTRTRARHRLIGAVVLLGTAVIGFPLLFETQPRPVPVDLPIHIPKKNEVPPLALPGEGRSGTAVADAEFIHESAEEAGRDVDMPEPVAPLKSAARGEARGEGGGATASKSPLEQGAAIEKFAKAEAKPAARAEPKEEPRAEAKLAQKAQAGPEPKPAPKPEPEARKPLREEARSSDAGRAQALLEGRAITPRAEAVPVADKGRFVLQVGAFSEGQSAREARQKVERLGLQSYTQEVETSEGRRIRVRVGPFSSREAAEQAAAKVRTAGLPAALLPPQ